MKWQERIQRYSDTYFFRRLEKAIGGKRRNLVNRRLRGILNYAFNHSNYYRQKAKVQGDRNNRKVKDIQSFPIMSKKDLRNSFDDLLIPRSFKGQDIDTYFETPFGFQRRFQGKYLAFHTSGSSGYQANMVWNERELFRTVVGYYNHIKLRAPSNQIHPRVAYIGIVNDYVGGNSWAYEMKKLVPLEIISAFQPMESILRELNQTRPNWIMTKPTLLGELARFRKSDLLKYSPSQVIFSGENINQTDKDAIQEYFGTTPWNSYSTCETGPVAFQTPGENSLSVMEDLVYLELLDDEGNTILELNKAGNVVVTSYINHTVPIIRYNTGDVASYTKFDEDGVRITPILGRNTNKFRFSVKGTEFIVPEYPFWNIYVRGVFRYQIRQDALDSLNVNFVFDKNAIRSAEDRSKVEDSFKGKVRQIISSYGPAEDLAFSFSPVTRIDPEKNGKVKLTFPLRQESC